MPCAAWQVYLSDEVCQHFNTFPGPHGKLQHSSPFFICRSRQWRALQVCFACWRRVWEQQKRSLLLQCLTLVLVICEHKFWAILGQKACLDSNQKHSIKALWPKIGRRLRRFGCFGQGHKHSLRGLPSTASQLSMALQRCTEISNCQFHVFFSKVPYASLEARLLEISDAELVLSELKLDSKCLRQKILNDGWTDA